MRALVLTLFLMTTSTCIAQKVASGLSFSVAQTRMQDNQLLDSEVLDGKLGTCLGISAFIELDLSKRTGLRLGADYSVRYYKQEFSNIAFNLVRPGETGQADGIFEFRSNELSLPVQVFQEVVLPNERFILRYGGGLAFSLPLSRANRYQLTRTSSPSTSSFFFGQSSFSSSEDIGIMSNIAFNIAAGIYMKSTGRAAILVEPYLRFAPHRFNLPFEEAQRSRSGIETGVQVLLFFWKNRREIN